MKLSTKAEKMLKQISDKNTKLGDLRTIAKDIKKDHQLAMELWSTEHFFARQLAILIMDKKLLTEEVIDSLVEDISQHNENEKLQLIDWLFANQLTRDKKTIALIESWEDSQSSLKRRTYWYYQARLRWTGQPQPGSEKLLTKIEKKIEKILTELNELLETEEENRKEVAELEPLLGDLRRKLSQNRYKYDRADIRF